MRDSRTLCGTFEEITHSNFNLPITAITGTRTRPSGEMPGGTALPERIASLSVCVYQTHDKSRRPLFLSANQLAAGVLASYIIHRFPQNCKILL